MKKSRKEALNEAHKQSLDEYLAESQETKGFPKKFAVKFWKKSFEEFQEKSRVSL